MDNSQLPAYPVKRFENGEPYMEAGLSKLEIFTLAAMQSTIAWLYNTSAPNLNGWSHDHIAREAISIAQATLSRLTCLSQLPKNPECDHEFVSIGETTVCAICGHGLFANGYKEPENT